MFNKKVVRIVAIVLAVLMGLGALGGAIAAFAADADAEGAVLLATPATGDDGLSPIPIIIGVVALLVVVACIIVPKLNKKDD